MAKLTRLGFRVESGERAFLIKDAQERDQSISAYIRSMIQRRMIEKMRGLS
jgi:hypothetical protein